MATWNKEEETGRPTYPDPDELLQEALTSLEERVDADADGLM